MLKEKIKQVLEQEDRVKILKDLDILRTAPTFAGMADIWAPALYKKDPEYFKHFIKYNLNPYDTEMKKTGQILLELADKENDAEFCRWLYPVAKRPEDWNKDLMEICKISDDKEFEKQLDKLKVNLFLTLEEKTVITLYNRSSELTREFLLKNLNSYLFKSLDYKKLLKLAEEKKDEEFYWGVFRKFASVKEWEDAIDKYIAGKPGDNITEELKKRNIDKWFQVGNGMINVCKKIYRGVGKESLEYLKERMKYLYSVDPRGKKELFEEIRAKEGPAVAYDLFLEVCNVNDWYALIKEIMHDKNRTFEQKKQELILIAPVGPKMMWFNVNDDLALEMYDKFPEVLRKYYNNNLDSNCYKLYDKAEEYKDTDMLDNIIAKAAKMNWLYRGEEKKLKKLLERMKKSLQTSLDQSRNEGMERMRNILSNLNAYEIWNIKSIKTNNELLRFLIDENNELWLDYPEYITDLLESPNIHVQIKAFDILTIDDARATGVIKKNLSLLLSTLLRGYYKKTLEKVFKVLENGSLKDTDICRMVMEKLKEATVIRTKNFPREKLIALLGRIKYYQPEIAGVYC